MKNKFKINEAFVQKAGLDIDINELDDLTVKRISFSSDDIEIEEGTAKGVISHIGVDGDGDVIIPSAFDFKRFEKNPIVLFQHEMKSPIGFAEKIVVERDRVIGVTRFGSTKEAQDVYTLMKDRVLRSFSVGFITKQAIVNGQQGFTEALQKLQDEFPEIFDDKTLTKVDRIITEAEIIEYSILSVPSNPDAIVIEVKSENEVETKTAEQLELPFEEAIEPIVEEVKVEPDPIVVEITETPVVVEEKVQQKVIKIIRVPVESKIKRVYTKEEVEFKQMKGLYESIWGV